MTRWWSELREQMPAPFMAALGLGAGFMAFVAWDQSHWWRVKEDYGFGWLVPIFVLYVLYERWPAIHAVLADCAADGSLRAAGWRAWVLRLLAGSALVGGILFFLLGAFYRAGAGTSQPGTLALTLGMIGILLPLLFLNVPAPGEGRVAAIGTMPADTKATPVVAPAASTAGGRGLLADTRLRLVGLFLFPVLVWLISAPMVSAVESALNLALLRQVVTVVAFVFETLGLPIEQQGNVLVLPTGPVGVEDACSGIRSLTGCLFAGSFLAAVFVEQLWRKLVLVAAAMCFAILTNLGRSLFLTAWAYNFGPAAIEGTVHDVAGYAVLGFTVAGLLCLLPVLNLKLEEAAPESPRT